MSTVTSKLEDQRRIVQKIDRFHKWHWINLIVFIALTAQCFWMSSGHWSHVHNWTTRSIQRYELMTTETPITGPDRLQKEKEWTATVRDEFDDLSIGLGMMLNLLVMIGAALNLVVFINYRTRRMIHRHLLAVMEDLEAIKSTGAG